MYMFDLFEKPIFDNYIYGFICLYSCVYVMCCYVLSVIMYMGICCVGIHWHKHENVLNFLRMKKLILANKIYAL